MQTIIPQLPNAQTLASRFRLCFPSVIRKEETVLSILSNARNEALVCECDGTDAGIVLWNKNTVLLLCVLPAYRGRGIGSNLLQAAEERLAARGEREIRFCDGFDYLTPGIPLWGNNRAFFEKRGYVHSWGDCECVDMAMDMTSFKGDGHRVGDSIRGVTYRFAQERDRQLAVDCARDGWEEFARYYDNPLLYEPQSPERVLIAETEGIAAGALIVSFETEANGVGSVGCTVTRKAYQNRGIATNMVRIGTGVFAERAIPRAYLGYTYTDIIPLYARSGYAVTTRYFMGVKTLVKEERA